MDHTGIDLIAKRPRSEERLGISVESRSRSPGTETDSVNIGRPEDFAKVGRVKQYMADAAIRTLEFRIESENW